MKLVINRQAREGETFISGDDHPLQVRHRVDCILGIGRDEDGHTVHVGDATIVTYSPVAIDHVIRVSRMENEPHPMGSVYYAYGGKDHRLVEFMEEAWLVHYGVGELYSDLEIEVNLRKWLLKEMGLRPKIFPLP